jgi:serine/threonine-protein kinase RsbW
MNIGTGLTNSLSVHEAASKVDPARVTYIASDPAELANVPDLQAAAPPSPLGTRIVGAVGRKPASPGTGPLKDVAPTAGMGVPAPDEGSPCRETVARSKSFTARTHQVRAARRFLAEVLADCPAADEAILCLSELASNAVLHSASRLPDGIFIVSVDTDWSSYVLIEVHDNGGVWDRRPSGDGRAHGLEIVATLATSSGLRGDAASGWIAWARFEWCIAGACSRACGASSVVRCNGEFSGLPTPSS